MQSEELTELLGCTQISSAASPEWGPAHRGSQEYSAVHSSIHSTAAERKHMYMSSCVKEHFLSLQWCSWQSSPCQWGVLWGYCAALWGTDHKVELDGHQGHVLDWRAGDGRKSAQRHPRLVGSLLQDLLCWQCIDLHTWTSLPRRGNNVIHHGLWKNIQCLCSASASIPEYVQALRRNKIVGKQC